MIKEMPGFAQPVCHYACQSVIVLQSDRLAASGSSSVQRMVRESSDKLMSIKIARVLMKIAGFWTASTEKERKLLKGLLIYTLIAIATAIWTEACDFYFSIGDFHAMAYVACSTMPVVLVMVKVFTCVYHRQTIHYLIKFAEDNFWYARYDEFGAKALQEVERKGLVLVSTFSFFVTGTAISYIMTPIIENIGKNESERILPFNIWIGVPTSLTPYFEITFVLQVLALLHAGLCFCCFDNFLGLLNIHVAVQFRILGHKLQGIFGKTCKELSHGLDNKPDLELLKKYVFQHEQLIDYVRKLEGIFSYAIMCQLVISSIMICVGGFQIFLAQGTFVRRMIFIAHINGCFFQLFVITITSNEVLLASSTVSDDIYKSGWELSLYKAHKEVKSAVLMIMIRASRRCCITAAGFFPISVETFTAVISTAFSYFTLLRKFDTDLSEK